MKKIIRFLAMSVLFFQILFTGYNPDGKFDEKSKTWGVLK